MCSNCEGPYEGDPEVNGPEPEVELDRKAEIEAARAEDPLWKFLGAADRFGKALQRLGKETDHD